MKIHVRERRRADGEMSYSLDYCHNGERRRETLPFRTRADSLESFGKTPREMADMAAAGGQASPLTSGTLEGMVALSLPARERTFDGVQNASLRMIPYFAWSNRDRSSMITWIATREDLAPVDPRDPRNMKFVAVRASHTYDGDTVDAIRMKHTPRSSADMSIPRWTSWPQRGRSQWIEIDLGDVQEVVSVSVYWYNDDGGVQLPGAWRLQAPDGDGWADVEITNTDAFSALPDNYNTVHPAEPLRTGALRLSMRPRHDQTCVGILALDIATR